MDRYPRRAQFLRSQILYELSSVRSSKRGTTPGNPYYGMELAARLPIAHDPSRPEWLVHVSLDRGDLHAVVYINLQMSPIKFNALYRSFTKGMDSS